MERSWTELLQEQVLSEGGIWTGKRAMDFLHSIGFDCTIQRARVCMQKIAEKEEVPVSVAEGRRWIWEVSHGQMQAQVSLQRPEAGTATVGFEINLNFPNADYTVRMPAVPQRGDTVDFDDPSFGDTTWHVVEVSYSAYADDTEGSINLALDPSDERTKRVSELHRTQRPTQPRVQTDEK